MQTQFSHTVIYNPYNSEESFDFYVATLVNFVRFNGNYPSFEQQPELYKWIELQRMKIKKGTLSPTCFETLKSIHFLWQKKLVNWDKQFTVLKEKIKSNIDPATDKSYYWLKRQLTKLKGKKLFAYGAERMIDLIAFGKQNDKVLHLKWQTLLSEVKEVCEAANGSEEEPNIHPVYITNNKVVERFMVEFEVLKAYLILHGKYPSATENKDLYWWMSLQRSKRNSNTLSEVMIDKLDSIGFPWSLNERNWEKNYRIADELVSSGKKITRSNQTIYGWITRQMAFLQSGSLKEDKRNKIEKLLQHAPYLTSKNVSTEVPWDEIFDRVREYIVTYGSLPSKFFNSIYSPYYSSLENWLRVQCRNYMKLDRMQKIKLDSLELHKYTRKSWIQMYTEVEAYVLANKRLPGKKSNEELYKWITKQRPYLHKENCNTEKYKLLKKLKISFKATRRIGIMNWTSRNAKWEKKVTALMEFREKNVGCWPTIYTDNLEEKQLAAWVFSQRQAYAGTNSAKKRSISPERIKKLDSIGFIWRMAHSSESSMKGGLEYKVLGSKNV